MAVHLKRIGDDQLSQAFQYFDKNQSGYIEVEELKEALLQDDPGPNNEQLIKDIMLDVDEDKVFDLMFHDVVRFINCWLDHKHPIIITFLFALNLMPFCRMIESVIKNLRQ